MLIRFLRDNSLLNFIWEFAISYPTPSSLSYLWNFGFLSLIALIFQILTGIILATFYISSIDLAFLSIEHIMREVNFGFFLRYFHANGASFFFFVVYLHLLRGLFYGSYSYPRRVLWLTGILMLVIMILTSFLGYVLPWGQMSYWAATVITSLLSIIPIFGFDMLYWLWGGYSVDLPTLTRFFSFHFFLPFLLLALSIFHLILLHNLGSSNPLGLNLKLDLFNFTPFFFLKDISFTFSIIFGFLILVFFYPNLLGHSDNYIFANSLVTPVHIVPEWYFLPFYAILRATPSKVFGTIFLLLSIFILALLPFFDVKNIRSGYFRFFFNLFFYFFIFIILSLGWVGGQPITLIYYNFAQYLTFLYFLYFLIILIYHYSVDTFLFNFFFSVYFIIFLSFSEFFDDLF